MTGIELFSGSGELTKVFNEAGHHFISVDKRRRKGICEPSFRADILNLKPYHFPFERPDVVWASPTCTAFSYGAGDFYFDKNGTPKENAPIHIKLLYRTLTLIEELKPRFFFIENPRGRMRYQKTMIDFIARNNACIKTITLSSYGFPTIKPTDIFTNAHDYTPKTMAPFGRSAKNPLKKFSNLTLVARQKTPRGLAEEILKYCESKVPGG